MKIDNLNLICYKNQYLLVDHSVCNPILLSKRAYELLVEYNEGVDIEKLNEKYGISLVTSILEKINLLNRDRVTSTKKNFYHNAKSAVDKYLVSDIDLLEGMIMVSQTCNMACKYCYGGDSGSYNDRGLMSKERAKECFEYLLLNGKNRKFQKVVFFGGEPLLNIEVIKYIIELWEQWKTDYKEKEVYFALTTNGMLLTDEIVKYFKDKKVGITISVDGYREIHDYNRVMADGSPTFDKVMDSINLLRKHDMPISIRSTITSGADIDKLYDFFETQNFDIHALAVVDYPMTNPQKEYQMNLETYKKFSEKEFAIVKQGCRDIISEKKNTFRAKQMSMTFHKTKSERPDYPFICGAGCWLVTFGLDGYIYPCNRVVGNDNFRIGDLQTGIDKTKMAQLLNDFLSASKMCDSCWAASLCKGRCFHQKMNDSGGFEDLPSELCDIYRENFTESLLFAHEMKEYVMKYKDKMDDAIIRFEAHKMMKDFCEEEH